MAPSANNDTRYKMVKTMIIVIIYLKNEPFFDSYNFEDILNLHGFFAKCSMRSKISLRGSTFKMNYDNYVVQKILTLKAT
jgi:hypothetical protein